MAKIAQIIKYEGDNSTFVWKHPCEDFNSLTQLIVHESQEALFMMNGQALDLFGAGRYTLQTQNIPLIGRMLSRVTDDKTPFHCEVYFINKTEQMSIKWGTDSKVQFVEPTYGFPLSIGASGEMSLRVQDAKKLLIKLVGTENCLEQSRLVSFFRAFLMTKVKSYLAQTIKSRKINIFEIDEHLQSISDDLLAKLAPDFLDYGIALERFFVTNVAKPDGEAQYEKFKSLHYRQYADVAEAKLRQQIDVIDAQTQAQKVVIDAQAQAAKRVQEGYSYHQERGFDVAKEIASNPATGQMTNLGIGIGTMAGVGGAMAGVMGESIKNVTDGMHQASPAAAESALKCIKCGTALPAGAKFCPDCGEKVTQRVPEGMLICPECGSVVVKGKFCPECGHKYITVCPGCGKDVPAGAKFCLECGLKI